MKSIGQQSRISPCKRQADFHKGEIPHPRKSPRLSPAASSESVTPDTSSRARKITTVGYKIPPQWKVPDLNNTFDELNVMANEATKIDRKLKQHLPTFIKDRDDFVKTYARHLQENLIDQSKKPDEWLKPFWDEMYLKARNATPINVSFAVEFDKSTWLEKRERSVNTIYSFTGCYS